MRTLIFVPMLSAIEGSSTIYIYISVLPNVANDDEDGIAPVANINQLPRTNGFTSPLNDAVTSTSRVELSILMGEKKPAPSGV